MKIFIPTSGRSNRQPSLDALVAAGLKPDLVVQSAQFEAYRHYETNNVCNVQTLPPHITTINATRQYILEIMAPEKFCMVDDDLKFFHRREDDKTKLRDIEPHELFGAFAKLEAALEVYGHAGFAPREGANHNTEETMENTRIMRVLAYRRADLMQHGIKFTDIEFMSDFHVNLCLLEHGIPNVVLNQYANNQFGSNTVGGCSVYRTPAKLAAAAHRLHELHPKAVSVIEKETKTAWGGGIRTDVRIQWKKAYQSGKWK